MAAAERPETDFPMPIRIAVDAMGGDHAPAAIVAAALSAVSESDLNVRLTLFGPLQTLTEELRRQEPLGHPHIDLADAPQVIGMGESPVKAVRRKPRSSIHAGLTFHREGRADAFISAGNTGAVTAASLFMLGRLPDVERPSIPTYFPTVCGKCLVLDVGSNLDSRPEHLLQYGQMGTAFATYVMDVPNPRVALLNIGEEPAKGNDVVRTAYRLLSRATNIRFIGNIEGRDIMHHKADVVVCDGFVGNVVLKLTESVMTALPVLIRQAAATRQLSAATKEHIAGILRDVARRFDPETYGSCAPLLGVNGTVFVAHGRSSESAFKTALRLTARSASAKLTNVIGRLVQHAA